ncbi:MAG: QueT transporter family protein [Oscillospiraceae bacterium]|nr:QueT transporter family protein [Oscillospiraceae bacterium]
MKRFTTLSITRMALLAAIYAALTLALAPISFGQFQIRVSEAMTVLPFFFPEAVPALFVGCLLANLLGTLMGVSLGVLDIVFGSLATLLAAYLTSKCKKLWLAPLPPVVINAVVIGALLAYTLTPEAGAAGFPMFAGSVGLGQVAACYGLGIPLLLAVKKLAPRGIG